MRHDPKVVRQWAANVLRSPYWDDVHGYVRDQYIEQILDATLIQDIAKVERYAINVLVLNDVVRALGALSIDVNPRTSYPEMAAEMNDAE